MKKKPHLFDTVPDLEPLLILPDMHAPYEDHACMSIVYQAIRRVKPKRVINVGDFADICQLSRHVKDAEARMPFNKEIAGAKRARARLDEVCAAVGAKKVITLGNHEERLKKYIAENAPELDGMLPTIEEMLELKKNGWKVYGYGEVYRVGSLHFTHDLNTAGVYAHERSRVAMGGSTVIGHTHRMAISHAGTYAGGRHVAAMFGWLGDFRFAKYIKKAMQPHWQHGFGIGYHDQRTGFVTLQGIPIVQGRAIVNGVVIEARKAAV